MLVARLVEIFRAAAEDQDAAFRYGLETDAALDTVDRDPDNMYIFVEASGDIRASLDGNTEDWTVSVTILKQDTADSDSEEERRRGSPQSREKLLEESLASLRSLIAYINDTYLGEAAILGYTATPVYRVFALASGLTSTLTVSVYPEC